MTLKLSLTVKHNLQMFVFFQLKSLGRAKIVYAPRECMIFTFNAL
jgi:hypothetical protein